jgi:hypothetical protein
MSTFNKAKKKVEKAAEKTKEEAKKAGGKTKRAGKKGVEKARKIGHETKARAQKMYQNGRNGRKFSETEKSISADEKTR